MRISQDKEKNIKNDSEISLELNGCTSVPSPFSKEMAMFVTSCLLSSNLLLVERNCLLTEAN